MKELQRIALNRDGWKDVVGMFNLQPPSRSNNQFI